jgi:lipoprotein-anchoring transpeptidase ErfK/SrfK
MWTRTVQLAAVFTIFVAASPPPEQRTHQRTAPQKASRVRKAAPPKAAPPSLPCGDYLSFQVLLDRQGFSPGTIDGRPGDNLTHAIGALQAARNLPPTRQADCDTWHSLGGEQAQPTLATYVITPSDVEGPFEANIPRDLVQQSKLEALSYRSPIEQLAERFHTSPAFLQRINDGVSIEAGREIKVPAVPPFDPATKPSPDPLAEQLTIQVSREDSALRAIKPDGAVVFFAPVTTGSQHDPLPTGDWKVLGLQWYPPFHYNPTLFWDAKPGHSKATIKPGPNNPVGVVWIALSLEHYGLHGTPEPENVGHTQSHGCVRLTNWDAARVAALVKPGTPVQFR